MKMRFHAQTAGCSLQDKQPEVNLMRVAYQALAAVLGGCQSLHTNSMDETLALPSEHAVTLAGYARRIERSSEYRILLESKQADRHAGMPSPAAGGGPARPPRIPGPWSIPTPRSTPLRLNPA